jgi:hypothetical protein
MIWIAVTSGAQHDYIAYLSESELVLSGADPWSTDNAYGPLHNILAYLLAPKMCIVTALLVANAAAAHRARRLRPIPATAM